MLVDHERSEFHYCNYANNTTSRGIIFIIQLLAVA